MGQVYLGLYQNLDKRGFDVSNASEIFRALKYGAGQTILEHKEPNVKERVAQVIPNVKERVAQVIRLYEALQESLQYLPTELDEFDF